MDFLIYRLKIESLKATKHILEYLCVSFCLKFVLVNGIVIADIAK